MGYSKFLMRKWREVRTPFFASNTSLQLDVGRFIKSLVTSDTPFSPLKFGSRETRCGEFGIGNECLGGLLSHRGVGSKANLLWIFGSFSRSVI